MGLPLLLGLLLSRAGGFLVSSLEQPNNCITAENLCVADPACNAAYQTLQNCSPSLAKSNSFLLHHEARNRCQEAETMIRNSYFGECKCHRRSRKQKRCLHIYWTVHSTLAQEELYKKELNVPDNHDGVVTDFEPGILECEVKWTLGRLSNNKASGGDSIPAELFKILKTNAVKVLHPICQQIWKTQQWPQDWKRSVYIPIPKKGNAKECSNYRTIALTSHASKVMLKIPQAGLQQYVDRELPEVQAGFCRGRGTRDQIANIRWIIEKAREFQKNIYFCFIDYAKAFDCVDHNKLWQVLKEMGVPDHPICLLKNLYAGQEATVRTGHGNTDWFKIEKGVRQGCILSPCLFNLHAEHVMRKAGLDELQVGIKIAGRNNNLRYADDTTLMAESEEPLDAGGGEECKSWLETQH
ncbi:hypothetical protein EYD10_04261 [Varanus komodoensis]|nr:hypothetical protein EYD10_04261 [Varanus komodoensis]